MSTFKRAKVVMLPTEKASNMVQSFKEKSFDQLTESSICLINKKANYQLSNIQSIHLYFLSGDKIKEGDWYYDSDFKSIRKSCFPGELPPFLRRRCKKIIVTTDESLLLFGNSISGKTEKSFKGILPQPSQSFIEKYVEEYNKGNQITEVLVEYETEKLINVLRSTCSKTYINWDKNYSNDSFYTNIQSRYESRQKWLANYEPLGEDRLWKIEEYSNIEKLKVNPKDNTITIKKVKDNFSTEETRTLCLKMQHDYTKYKESCHYGPNMREIADWTDKWLEENLYIKLT